MSDPGDDPTLQKVQAAITRQEVIVASMAGLLVNLASHYDQMAGALKDTESGEVFSEGEMWSKSFLLFNSLLRSCSCIIAMNRDTEELPRIMADIEQHSHNIGDDQWVFYRIFLSFSILKPNHR